MITPTMTPEALSSLTLGILRKPVTVTHNPFRGLEAHEVEDTIVLRQGMVEAQRLMQAPSVGIIELVGPKGRGKTTHLQYLHEQHSQAPLFLLHKNMDCHELVEGKGAMVFIDSIHHLSLLHRLKVYKAYGTVVLTTHLPRDVEYWMARRAYRRFRFHGIETELLQSIIFRRLQLATLESITVSDVSQEAIEGLILRFGDDYRAIINHLYLQVQAHTQVS